MIGFGIEVKSVFSAVRTGSLNKAVCASSVKGYIIRLFRLRFDLETSGIEVMTHLWYRSYNLSDYVSPHCALNKFRGFAWRFLVHTLLVSLLSMMCW